MDDITNTSRDLGPVAADELLIREATGIAGVKISRMYQEIRAGNLQVIRRPGQPVRVRVNEVRRWLRDKRRPGRPLKTEPTARGHEQSACERTTDE